MSVRTNQEFQALGNVRVLLVETRDVALAYGPAFPCQQQDSQNQSEMAPSIRFLHRGTRGKKRNSFIIVIIVSLLVLRVFLVVRALIPALSPSVGSSFILILVLVLLIVLVLMTPSLIFTLLVMGLFKRSFSPFSPPPPSPKSVRLPPPPNQDPPPPPSLLVMSVVLRLFDTIIGIVILGVIIIIDVEQKHCLPVAS